MYATSDLTAEIEALIEAGDYEELSPDMIVTAIVGKKEPPDGADRDYYLLCANGYTRELVRKVANRYKSDNAEDHEKVAPQLILPGFKRLQTKYLVERRGQAVIVPVDHLSAEEIEAKAAIYESMGAGCLQHAEELRRYAEERPQGD